MLDFMAETGVIIGFGSYANKVQRQVQKTYEERFNNRKCI